MDDFRQTLSNITKNITKASGELIKTTKMNLAISGEEERLKATYIEIGKKVHEIYMYGGSLGKFFDEKYLEICEIEKKLSELRGQLNIATGTRTCPKCKRSIDRMSEFCPKCGSKMDAAEAIAPREPDRIIPPAPEPAPAISPEPVFEPLPPETFSPEEKTCKACGAICAPADKFCLTCGRMV